MIAENGQSRTDFYECLERCCQLVGEVYGKPNRSAWTNGDYVNLSRLLFRQTKVQISPNTLKRIFGKIRTEARYYPQKATRDALAQFIGYPDWEHFAQEPTPPEPAAELPAPAAIRPRPPVPSTHAPRRAPSRNGWFWGAGSAVLLLGMVALFLFWKKGEVPTGGVDPVRLVCKNPLGENPHSAIFQVEGAAPLPDPAAALHLDFGDGKPVARVDAFNHPYTHYYEKPGRYFAVLRQGKRSLDTATVYLPTKGWTATANMMHDTTRVYPIEIPNLFKNSQRRVSAAQAARAGIDTNRTFFIEFVNAQATAIDGDNFELTTRLTTSPTRAGVRCSQVGLTVWGESRLHQFDVMKPGCVYWADMQFSEQFKSGQREDLSFLGADLRAGGTLKLRVVNQRVRLFINDRPVYETRYAQPLKRIYGVNLQFSGVGTVHSFLLKDLKTGTVFEGGF